MDCLRQRSDVLRQASGAGRFSFLEKGLTLGVNGASRDARGWTTRPSAVVKGHGTTDRALRHGSPVKASYFLIWVCNLAIVSIMKKNIAAESNSNYLTETIQVDKAGSVTFRLKLNRKVQITDHIKPQMGNVVAVRTLTDNPTYNHLELPSGRLARIKVDDIVIGAFGARRALKGFVGDVPDKVNKGDKLHLLNMGGVIGRYSGRFHGLGRPIQVEMLGTVVQNGKPLNIAQGALEPVQLLKKSVPLLFVMGTAMHVGKTQAVSELIQLFTRHGYRVAGAKVSGVAALRDTLNMEDHGAFKTLSFIDCGYPSTVTVNDLGPIVRTIIHHLSQKKPDIIAIELGDGILGGYNVDSIFKHRDIVKQDAIHVLCAPDFVGAWGGVKLLQQLGVMVDIISGPVTDSTMGVQFIKKSLNLSGANAINEGYKLFKLVETKFKQFQLDKQAVK